MCNYGLEQVNWGLLALIPVFLFIKWVFSPPNGSIGYSENTDADYSESSDECEICEAPAKRVKTRECPVIKPKCAGSPISPHNSINQKNTGLTCPAKPISLATECGISRFA